jgi:ABC-2 type transport system permease protein
VGFPLVAMPFLAQIWAGLLPYTHYIRVQMEQLQMGAPAVYSVATPLWMVLGTGVLLAASAGALVRAAGAPDSWGGR